MPTSLQSYRKGMVVAVCICATNCPALSSPAETAAKSFPWSASTLSPAESASLVLMLVRNELSRPQLLQVQVSDRALAIELPPDSVGTLAMKPA